MNKRPFIVYWNNIPAPYMVERFNALADRGVVNFEVWFNERLEPDRSWDVDESTWRFRYRYLPRIRIGRHDIHFPTPLLGRRPDVLISLYAEPAFVFGWLVARLRGVCTAFWCEITRDAWVKRRPWKEWLKKVMFRRVDWTIGAGEDGRQYAIGYGVPVDRAVILRHSVDVEHYRNGSSAAAGERDELREKLGLQGVTFLYVGRFWWGKGLTHLLEAFKKVQQCIGAPVSLLLVGDGEEEQSLKELVGREAIENVVFVKFQQKHELPRYYALADVFVFPTLGDPYGMVVDEAMACGLPVIATDAAGEIRDRVSEGENGFVVSAGESVDLAERMSTLLLDPELRRRMAESSRELIAQNTPPNWSLRFESLINDMTEKSCLR